jgi:hypothetical protein
MFCKGSFQNLHQAIGPVFQVRDEDPLDRCHMSLVVVHILFFFAE